MKKYGVVFFDNDISVNYRHTIMSGWASMSGEDPFRVKSVTDLSDDVIWLSNIKKENIWRSGLVQFFKIKHSSYLKIDVDTIIKELALNISDTTGCVKTISNVFSKIMDMFIENIGEVNFEESELINEIRLKTTNDKTISTHTDEALLRAYQDNVVCGNTDKEDGKFMVNFKRPRLHHANYILDTKIPGNSWSFFEKELHREAYEDPYIVRKPFLAKVQIVGYKDLVLNFGGIEKLLILGDTVTENGRKRDRDWITDIEYKYLSKFLSLKIDALFYAEDIENINYYTPNYGVLSDYMYSLGLYADILWQGLSAKSIKEGAKKSTLVSPRSCWLRSKDRFLCLSSAIVVAAAGFDVVSYGSGSVVVKVKSERLPILLDVAQRAGLIVPSMYVSV